jgi:RNA polymerase sigma-70 factor (ECF subfamily)
LEKNEKKRKILSDCAGCGSPLTKMEESNANHEAFLGLLLRHEGQVRAAIRAVVHRSEDVDDVMQAVSVVAWRKFETLTEPSGFGRWICMIARLEVLKFQRSRARDRFVLDESLVERIMEEGETENAERAQRLRLLESCLRRLPESRRHLMLQAYTPGCTTRAMAERFGRSEDSLYQLLRRLRLELRACMVRSLSEEGGVA